jgi:hypothetical protein
VECYHGLEVEELVGDFVKDAKGTLWFVQVKAFRLA